jgi:hypothetical protein
LWVIVLLSIAGAVMAATWLAWGTPSHAQAPKPGAPPKLCAIVAGEKAPCPSSIGKL